MAHRWLKGETATDHDILPEIKSFIAKARLRRGIEMVKLTNRIAALKMQEDEEEVVVGTSGEKEKAAADGKPAAGEPKTGGGANRLSRAARSAIFREVVLAKVREMKQQEEKTNAERTLTELQDRGAKR